MPSHNASRMAELVWACGRLRVGFQYPGASVGCGPVHTPMSRQREGPWGSDGLSERREGPSPSVATGPSGSGGPSPSSVGAPGRQRVIPEALANILMGRKGGKSSPHQTRINTGDSSLVLNEKRSKGSHSAIDMGPGAFPPSRDPAETSASPTLWSEIRRCTYLALTVEIGRAQSPGERGNDSGAVAARSRLPRPSRIDARSLARLSQGLAMADQADRDLFCLIEDVALSLPADEWPVLGPDALSDMSCALARLGMPAPRLMQVLCKSFTAALHQGRGRVFGRGGDETGTIPALDSAARERPDSPSAPHTIPNVKAPSSSSSSRGHPRLLPLHVSKKLWATSVLSHKDTDMLYAVSCLIQEAQPRWESSYCSTHPLHLKPNPL